MPDQDNIVVLKDEEGNEAEFEYLDLVQRGEKEYIVLFPTDQEEDSEEGEVVIFQVVFDDKGEEEYLPIEDEALLYSVFEEFQQRMAEEDEEE